MAWTTSAGLHVRPVAKGFVAAPLAKVRVATSLIGRAAGNCHPAFALAVPLAGLGFLAPLLPSNLTSTLLLCCGALLVLFAVGSGWRESSSLGSRRRSLRDAGANASRNGAAASPQGTQNSRERSSRRTMAPSPRRLRFAAEPKDRSWAELMSRVNHDLRTPLNAVMGFSEAMTLELFGPLGDDRYHDYVHHIRDSATELLKSAEDTLALTALMATPANRESAEACDIAILAKDAWSFLARKAAARAINFEASIPLGLEVIGEPRALRQVLVNILSEGIARAANGARVILLADTESELVELSLSVSNEGKRRASDGGSLAICLARTLLEMQGASLLEFDAPSHGWRAVTVLDRAAQSDFFSKARKAGQGQGAALEEAAPAFG
jgi:signal transduction histidine kinase